MAVIITITLTLGRRPITIGLADYPVRRFFMEPIWAPWRIEYIRMEKPAGCILCEKPGEDNDMANYILHRAKKNFIMLNSYPYNPGHLLVVPYRHVASLEELTSEELHEHIEIVSHSIEVLRRVFEPAGFNVGMNLGRVAGAGIDDHIHSHIIPRWQGDNNFMPVVADTRVVPQALEDTYKQLKDRF
jgi:ATP adenylyltransferase